ncbi:MAG: LacI family transcriptional regulator [Propionibacteriaceae bacterium]|nr:LacI family transcriptional regulator [Propionibacteriaceae bacterium]
MTSRTTLAAVARQTGVSLATVSKVLNGRDGVSAATRQRVGESIRTLGYRPTTARADLPGVGVRRVNAVFTATDGTMYVPQLLNSLLVTASRFRLDLVTRLYNPPDTEDDLGTWARFLLGGGCQGAIFVATVLTPAQILACERVGLPIVTIDCYSSTGVSNDLISVGVNNFAGGYSAVQHVLALGHRVIGLIRGPETADFARERAYGCLAALSAAGVTLPEDRLIVTSFDHPGGLDAGRTLLRQPDRPTAIVTHCDAAAMGVMEAARELRLRVPDDLSIVGFDDTKLALWSTPQLTTVNQPLSDIARVALRTMAHLLSGQEPDTRHVQLATKLVVRGSTGPVPAGRR